MPTYESCEVCGLNKPMGFECPWCAIKTLEAERDRYREALEALYEAANTKERVSLEDLEAADAALNL